MPLAPLLEVPSTLPAALADRAKASASQNWLVTVHSKGVAAIANLFVVSAASEAEALDAAHSQFPDSNLTVTPVEELVPGWTYR